MNDKSKSAAAGQTTRPKVVIERTYRAKVGELWELWTTKLGFESWWGPDGFRVHVHALEARLGGTLHYDMIADSPEMIAAMKQMGRPTSHEARAKFTEIRPHDRLAITSVIDFLPGLIPYESTIVAEFFPSDETVRMVVTLDPMHDEEFTKMQTRASRANSRSSTSGTVVRSGNAHWLTTSCSAPCSKLHAVG